MREALRQSHAECAAIGEKSLGLAAEMEGLSSQSAEQGRAYAGEAGEVWGVRNKQWVFVCNFAQSCMSALTYTLARGAILASALNAAR